MSDETDNLIAVEVKDRKASSWPSWCRQAVAEAREGMVPVVVRRTRGVPDVGSWECRTTDLLNPVGHSFVDTEAHTVDGETWFSLLFGEFVRLVREGEGR